MGDGSMPDAADLFGTSAPAPVIPLPFMQPPPLPSAPDNSTPAPPGAAAKRPRKPVDPNKPKKPRKRKEAPPTDGSTPGEPPAKKPRKKKEPKPEELGPDGQPLPKPKKPRKKKTDAAPGAAGEKSSADGASGKSGAAATGDEDDLGGDVGDEELIAASTVKRKKRGEDDEDDGEDDSDDEGEEASSADEGELQLGTLKEPDADDGDIFGDKFQSLSKEELAAHIDERKAASAMVAVFTPDQMERYEAFRRSRLAAPAVRKVMNSTLGFSVHHDCGIVMAGASKLFVGELIETARQVQEQWCLARGIQGPYGPLTPDTIREAYRRLKQQGKVPYAQPQRLLKR